MLGAEFSAESQALVVDLRREKITTVIGAATHQRAHIDTDEGVLVIGTLTGNIESRGGTVFVAEGATVYGRVVGVRVVIAGDVVGNVYGEDTVLGHTAYVQGDVYYTNVSFKSEARIDGRLIKNR